MSRHENCIPECGPNVVKILWKCYRLKFKQVVIVQTNEI